MTTQQQDQFQKQGYVCPVPCLPAQEVAEVLAHLDRVQNRFGGRLPPFANAKPHLLFPWLWKLVQDPRLTGLASSVLGPDLLCYGSSFIIKPPASSKYVAWHQDVTYWGLSSPKAVTIWIALTPSTSASGCVRVVPGSHVVAQDHTDSNDPDNLLGRGEVLVMDVDETKSCNLHLEPGEMSMHDSLIVHGSDPNQTDIPRIGFAVRYIPATTSPKEDTPMSATLALGRNHSQFSLELEPMADMEEAAMKRHRDIFRSGMKTIFDGKSSTTFKKDEK